MRCNLRQIRRETGLSQQQLADTTGISQPAIGYWEREERSPNLQTARIVAKVLGKRLEDIWPEEETT